MKIRRARFLQLACILALVALALMVWSMLDERPVPVITAMSVGQVLGTCSLLAYLVVVIEDLRTRIRRARDSDRPRG